MESLRKENEAAKAISQSLSNKLTEAEKLNRHFVTLLTQFFAFQIEEADLRKALTNLVPNVDAFIHEPPHAALPFSWKGQPCPATPVHKSRDVKTQRANSLPSLDGNPQSQQHPSDNNQASKQSARKQDELDKEMELVLPKLHAGGVPTVAYRIRGKPTHELKQQFIPAGFSKEEEEKKLIEQLNKARKRMQRHIKLQVCVLTWVCINRD